MWRQRVEITAALRVGMHLIATTTAHDRDPRRRWLALGAGSLAADVALVAAMVRDREPPGHLTSIIDALDLAAWTLEGAPDPQSLRGVYMATVMPATATRAFLARAGVEAQPVPPGAGAWPPESARATVERIAIVARPAVVAALIQYLLRHKRGLPTGWGLVGWAGLAAAMGSGTAMIRDAQHRRALRLWRARRSDERRRVVEDAEWESAVVADAAHHLPRTLYRIGSESPVAREAGREAGDQPRRRSARSDGELLGRAGRGLVVDPASARLIWLDARQVRQMQSFLADVDANDSTDHELPDTLMVTGTGEHIELFYLGRTTTLRRDRTPLTAVFDPVAVGMLANAVTKLSRTRAATGGVRWPVAAVATAFDLAAWAAFVTGFPQRSRNPRLVVALTSTGSVCWLTGLAATGHRERSPLGSDVFPEDLAFAALGPVGHYWDDLGHARWLVVGALGSLWAMAIARRRLPVRPVHLVNEVIIAGQFLLALRGFAARSQEERDALERRFSEGWQRELADAARDARRREIERLRALLQLGHDELAEIANRLSPKDLAALQAELEEVDRALAARAAACEAEWVRMITG